MRPRTTQFVRILALHSSCLLALWLCACGPKTTPTVAPASGDQWVLGADHIGLAVTDLAASRDFFVDALGFTQDGEDPDYPAVFLSNGHAFITLWRVADPNEAIDFNRKRNVGLHHLALAVSSFDALEQLHKRLANYPGIQIEFAPELAYGGPTRHMMLRDPSGLRIELTHSPG